MRDYRIYFELQSYYNIVVSERDHRLQLNNSSLIYRRPIILSICTFLSEYTLFKLPMAKVSDL